MPELNAFNGGLSRKVAPHFVQAHEAVELINADIVSGSLKPFPDSSLNYPGVLSNFYDFNGTVISSNDDRSYVEYGEKLYFSDGKQAQWTSDGVNFYPLGFSSTTDSPIAEIIESTVPFEFQSEGTLPIGTLQYRLVNETDNLISTFEIENINEGNKGVFTFSEAKDYKVYRKVNEVFLLVGSITGPGDLEDGSTSIGTIGQVTIEGTLALSNYQAIISMIEFDGKLYMTRSTSTTSGYPNLMAIYQGLYDVTVDLVIFNLTTKTFTIMDMPELLTSKASRALGLHIINNELYFFQSYWTSLSTERQTLHMNKLVGSNWGSRISISVPSRLIDIDHYGTNRVTYGTLLYTVIPQLGKAYTFDGTTVGSVSLGVLDLKWYTLDQTSIIDDVVYIIVRTISNTSTRMYKCPLGGNSWEEITSLSLPNTVPIQAWIWDSREETTSNSYLYTTAVLGGNMSKINRTIPIMTNTKIGLYNIDLDNSQISSYELGIDIPYAYFYPQVGTLYEDNYWVGKTDPIEGGTKKLFTLKSISLSEGFSSSLGDPMYQNSLEGSYTYKVTYCDSDGGNETAPSEPSSVIEVEKSSVEITLPTYGGSQTHMRIYRLGGNISSYRLVEQIVSSSTIYYDNVPDIELGEILTTEGTFAAPEDIKFLTEHGGRLWGAAGTDYTKLYYSDIADPTEWAPLQYIEISNPISGLGSTGLGLVVFTNYTTEIILGYDGTTFQKRLVSKSQGCTSHKSIQSKDGNLIFTSHVGICITNGSTITNLSVEKLGVISLTPKFSILYNDKYYVDAKNEILILDFLNGGIFYSLAIRDFIGMGIISQELTASNGLNGYSLIGGANSLNFTYRSGNLTEGAISNLKEYDEIRINSAGEGTISVYISNEFVISSEFKYGLTRVGIPNKNNKGYWISFEISGLGEIYSIEYTLKGRSNE